MSIPFLVGIVLAMLVLAVIAEPVSRWLRLPHSLLMVVVGAIAAYTVTLGFGIDTGLRAASFHDLIFFVFLPVLIFEAALNMPMQRLRADLGVILFLAVAGMLLTTVVAAALLYWGIGHPAGFPWIAALLAGALLAATDPVAVVAQLKTLGAPERLGVVLEGESLFNDATAIVLFSICLSLALMPATEVSATSALIEFVKTFVGGALVGLVVGLMAAVLLRGIHEPAGHGAVTLAAAYGSFLIAEVGLHLSGVMGALLAGLVLAWVVQRDEKHADKDSLEFFWSALGYVANGSVFLLVGVTITVEMFRERWLAMLIAIAAIVLARICSTYGGLALLNPWLKTPVPVVYQTAMVWGGLRGAVTLALALSLPTELDYWWTIQSMAFGVVLFTLLVQAPTTPMLLRRMGLSGLPSTPVKRLDTAP